MHTRARVCVCVRARTCDRCMTSTELTQLYTNTTIACLENIIFSRNVHIIIIIIIHIDLYGEMNVNMNIRVQRITKIILVVSESKRYLYEIHFVPRRVTKHVA